MISLDAIKKHNVLGELLSPRFTRYGGSSYEWRWKYLFEGRSDIFFRIDESFLRIYFVASSCHGREEPKSPVPFINLVDPTGKLSKEDIVKVFIDEFEVNAAIFSIEKLGNTVIEGANNIKKDISEILNFHNNKFELFFTNNSKSLFNYKINKKILSSIGDENATVLECLSFQNLNHFMIFSTIRTMEEEIVIIEDIYNWVGDVAQPINPVSFNILSCLKFYENNHMIVVVESDENKEFEFFYAGVSLKKSYADLLEQLQNGKDKYFFIMYNPIFYNTIHHALLCTKDRSGLDTKNVIRKNIRESMYGEDAEMK